MPFHFVICVEFYSDCLIFVQAMKPRVNTDANLLVCLSISHSMVCKHSVLLINIFSVIISSFTSFSLCEPKLAGM